MPDDIRDFWPGGGGPPALTSGSISDFWPGGATPAPAAAPRPKWGDYAGPLVRGVSGFFAGEGGPLGAAISGGGDLAAQALERLAGSRDNFNFGESAVAAGAGAIPFGRAGGLALRALKGAVLSGGTGAAMDVASQLGEHNPDGYDVGRTLRAGEVSGALGLAGAAGGYGLEKLVGRGSTAAAAAAGAKTLRQEAAEAPQFASQFPLRSTGKSPVIGGGVERVQPRTFPSSLEVQADRLGAEAGGPGTGRVGAGPLSHSEQLFGIDPDRLLPPPEPLGPTNQGGAGMTPEMGSRRLPMPWEPQTPSSFGGDPAQPFEIGPGSLNVPRRKGITGPMLPGGEFRAPESTPTPSVPPPGGDETFGVGPQDAAIDKASNDSFIQRFMRSLGIDDTASLSTEAEQLPTRQAPAPAPAAAAVADTPAVASETGIENARRRGTPYVPSELLSTWNDLRPKWQQTAAETGTNMGEDLHDFARRVLGEENPRKLMGAERKAVATAKAGGKPIFPGAPEHAPGATPFPSSPPATDTGAFPHGGIDESAPPDDVLHRFYDDESGHIDPELARTLALHGASGAAGALVGNLASDDEHKTRDTVGGGVLGALAPLVARNPALLNKYRYFSLLSGVGAQAKNVIGNAGSAAVRSAEEALSGNPGQAKEILSSVFSGDTIKRISDSFKHAPDADTRWGKNTGILGAFSRIMHSVDEGVTSKMTDAGLTPEEAQLSLFTSEPKSDAGKWLASRPEAWSLPIPFVRTATNYVERGLEHTPGLGMLPGVRNMRGDSTDRVLARQGLGAAAMVASYFGLNAIPKKYQPYVLAAMGPLGLPATLGASADTAASKRTGDPLTNFAEGEADTFRRALPLPTDSYAYSPKDLLSSFVPGAARDLSLTNPSDLEQSGLFDSAIAKVPFLNDALLRRKPRRRATP